MTKAQHPKYKNKPSAKVVSYMLDDLTSQGSGIPDKIKEFVSQQFPVGDYRAKIAVQLPDGTASCFNSFELPYGLLAVHNGVFDILAIKCADGQYLCFERTP